ncbi:sulfotransferase family protein [Nocardioides sp. AX2bis]|uniref:sulfotransferase family protein n=1 Tax=Nocardioides sp. AX2bis TaxID=2653157 RepID=UPI0012EFE1BC|nr:sulfotransferase [Nocardioides sp. AX2bis]VXC52159.1 conserved hypothetical protein [Nocardioides sp. AX2bis]
MPDHMPMPTFLVAGAGRSGTTGVVEGLRTHPGVFVTEPKEPHFFALHGKPAEFQAPGDEATINRVAVTEREAYLSLYADADQPCRGDGSVSTLYYHQSAIPEILAMNPQMRIVIILREPVDRAFSAYQYMRARGFEPEESFLQAFESEHVRQEAGWHHLWHYESMSRYAEAVSAFLAAFPAEQVGIWFYDDLQADYEGTVGEVLRHIGAPPAPGEGAGVPRVNISGTPRSATAHRIIWAATRNEAVRRTVKRFTSYRVRELVRRAALRPDGVDPRTRGLLAPRFAADLDQLAGLLEGHVQRELPAWVTAAH